jgi:hypothetical protein
MLECVWSYGNSKLVSGCQQHSNNRSSMMHGSDLGSTNFGRSWAENISLIILWCVEINSSFACFLLVVLDKSNMVNDVRE